MARGETTRLLLYGAGAYFGYTLAKSGTFGRGAQSLALDVQNAIGGVQGAALGAARGATGVALTQPGTGMAPPINPTQNVFSPTNPTGGQQPPAPTSASSPDSSASAWEAFHAELWPGAPAAYANQVWVHNATLGQWRYVNDPGQFGQYGIAQDASNVKYSSWGNERAFRANGNASEATASWFGRPDNSTGLNEALTVQGQSPPADAISGLRQAVQSGAWAPAGALGWEVLKLYGIV